jgi:hypothetical protein
MPGQNYGHCPRASGIERPGAWVQGKVVSIQRQDAAVKGISFPKHFVPACDEEASIFGVWVGGGFAPARGLVVNEHRVRVHQDLVARVKGAKANVGIAESHRQTFLKAPQFLEHIRAEQEACSGNRAGVSV